MNSSPDEAIRALMEAAHGHAAKALGLTCAGSLVWGLTCAGSLVWGLTCAGSLVWGLTCAGSLVWGL
ncbi:hypothetical protein ABZU99_13195, partial [Streptomyces sp. NPDC005266]